MKNKNRSTKVQIWLLMMLLVMFITIGCEKETVTENVVCLDGSVVNDSSECPDPLPLPTDDARNAIVSFNCPKGGSFSFTCNAESTVAEALDSGTWTVQDSSNQEVHSSTGTQMNLNLSSRIETRCDPFAINFEPACNEGFSCNDPLTQFISWPEADECQEPPLFVNFAATNTDEVGDFRVFFTNLSTKGGAPRETFSCEWSFNDPAITDGGRNQDCGFDGISHTYSTAGTISSVRLCTTYTPTGEEVCKSQEVTVDP